MATGGVWGWLGKIGKNEKGPIADLNFINGRDVTILFDSNVAPRADLRRARLQLAQELTARKCQVKIANLPEVEGVNGPDDCVEICGDATVAEVLSTAKLFAEVAVIYLETLVSDMSGRQTVKQLDIEQAAELISFIPSATARDLETARLAKVCYKHLPKSSIENLVEQYRDRALKAQCEAEANAHRAALLS